MGFFSVPSLGFASTLGAAIGGSDKQESANLEAAAAQERQDDVLQQAWMGKFDQSYKEWNKDKKEYDRHAQANQSFKEAAGGDGRVSDAVSRAYVAAGSPKDIMPFLRLAKDSAKDNPNPDPNYQETYLQELQKQAADASTPLQALYGRLKPKYRNMLPPIDLPAYGNQSGSTQGANYGGNSDLSPGAIPQGQSSNAPLQGSATGDTLGSTPNAPSQIPPQQIAQASPSTAPPPTRPFSLSIPGPNDPQARKLFETPGEWENEDAYNRARAQQGLPPVTGVMTKDKLQRDLIAANPNKQISPEDKARAAAQETVLTDYVKDPKYGLFARMSQARVNQSMNYDVESMLQSIQRGLKASAVIPMFDELNRVFTPLLGIDLAQMGVSNTVADTNILRKNVSNAIIDRLSTLHFGRITNYEAQIVKDGLTSTKNDPNTNTKVVLALKHILTSAASSTQKEYDATFPPGTNEYNPRKGLDVAGKEQAEYLKQEKAPWQQVNGTDPNVMSTINSIPNGQWFEDKISGTMYIKDVNGKLRKAGDIVNGG